MNLPADFVMKTPEGGDHCDRTSEKVVELGKPRRIRDPSVSPDCRWALYMQQDQAGSDLMLVENFR